MFAVLQKREKDEGCVCLVVDTDTGDYEWVSEQSLKVIGACISVFGVAEDTVESLSYKEIIDAQLMQYKLLGLDVRFELRSLASLNRYDFNVALHTVCDVITKNDFVSNHFGFPVKASQDDVWLLWQIRGNEQLRLKIPWGIAYVTPFCFDYVHKQLQEIIVPKNCFLNESSYTFQGCTNLERVVYLDKI